jgi:hypothetical protein
MYLLYGTATSNFNDRPMIWNIVSANDAYTNDWSNSHIFCSF